MSTTEPLALSAGPVERRWNFGPPTRPNLAFGATHTQVFLGFGVAALAVVLLSVFGWELSLWPIVCSAVLAVFLGCGVVLDRKVDAWVAPMTTWSLTVVRRRRRWRSQAHDPGSEQTQILPPPEAAGWKVANIRAPEESDDDFEFGVFRHPQTKTWVAVCRVRSQAFFLLDRHEKEALLEMWGVGLATFAEYGSPVSRLQWIERVAFAHNALDNQWDHFDDHRCDGAAADHYEDMLATALDESLVHETYVAIAIDMESAGRHIKGLVKGSGKRHDVGAFIVLWNQIRQLDSALDGLDVIALNGTEINRLIRTQYSPFADDIDDLNSKPWPIATDVSRGVYQTDETFHITSWMSNLPRSITNPAFLGQLLLDPGLNRPRTVSLTMAFTNSEAASRRIERQQVTRESGEDFMANQGFRVGARRRAEGDAMNQREVELADGHADCRWSGYVTVTGQTETEARDAHTAAANAARKAGGVHLRILHGEQHTAFTAAALPTGKART